MAWGKPTSRFASTAAPTWRSKCSRSCGSSCSVTPSSKSCGSRAECVKRLHGFMPPRCRIRWCGWNSIHTNEGSGNEHCSTRGPGDRQDRSGRNLVGRGTPAESGFTRGPGGQGKRVPSRAPHRGPASRSDGIGPWEGVRMNACLAEAIRLRNVSRTHSNGITRKIARRAMRIQARGYVSGIKKP